MKDVIIGSAKSKTMLFASAVVALGLIDQVTPILTTLVPQEYSGLAVAGIGLVTAALRLATTQPVSEK